MLRRSLTSEFGCGLESYLGNRSDSIVGYPEWPGYYLLGSGEGQDPRRQLRCRHLSSRSVNKAALQKQLGLKRDPKVPFLAMIGRIDMQKGVDITLEALRQLGEIPWQFVILGTGDPKLENYLTQMQSGYPERVRAVIRFDAPLGRLIYGGADMFLMPSRYEPCGLAQMIAMRYGCVPVVHATGGLKDTVHEGSTGFMFPSAEPGSMVEALQRALYLYSVSEKWIPYQCNGMVENFSWQKSASLYADVYRSLVPNLVPPNPVP